MPLAWCLMGIALFFVTYATHSNELYNKRENTMNSFVTHDNNGQEIHLTFQKVEGTSPQLTQSIQDVSNILIQAYANQEFNFAQIHPEAIPQDHFLKSLSPLFQEKSIDWNDVKEKITAIFNQFFLTTDFSRFSAQGEIHYLVTACDAHGKLLGFIQFLTNPEYPVGTIKAGMVGMVSEVQRNELRKILMSSIFKIIPDVQRIIVHSRVTNKDVLDLYSQWGFKHVMDGYWVNSEYMIANSKTLQDN